jgi:transcription factor SPN1
MVQAIQEDIQANADGKPALAKLRLLPQVTNTLRKSHLEGLILDNQLLSVIKDWLEPLPDKSLPALNIQRALFSILVGLPSIEKDLLKESHIGQIVLFYSRCARVDKAISRTADQLVTAWMRPILQRSRDWRQRKIQQEDDRDDDMGSRAGSAQPVRVRLSSLLPGKQESGTARRHAAIPRQFAPSYAIAPKDRMDVGVVASTGKETMERFRAFNKQLKASKAADKRV